MPNVPMRPARPHVIAGLSCLISGGINLTELVRKHFSPLAEVKREVYDVDYQLSDLVIYLVEAACADSQSWEIPKNAALFLALPNNSQEVSTEISRALNERFADADLTIMLSDDTAESISQALIWLDRGECEFAIVAACESADSFIHGAAILFANAGAAERLEMRCYATIANADLAQGMDAQFIEVSSAERSSAAVLSADNKLSYTSSLSQELSFGSERLAPLCALISSALALHLRVIPGAAQDTKRAPRPWIHPVSPLEPGELRCALAVCKTDAYLLSENGEDIHTSELRNLQEQSSELFIFSGGTFEELRDNIARSVIEISRSENFSFAELAFKQNCPGQTAAFKLAIIAASKEELLQLMEEAVSHVETAPNSSITKPGSKIYYTGRPAIKPGKMVFVYPGLGAAYPNMLGDLCFYFPEVRYVFDFVERLALNAGDKVIPSKVIFPVAGESQSSSQAMLATMDSSVVALLLAEWAIYNLLTELGVTADVMLGCSTGEFASITMSEAINIFDAAQVFYTLSTGVARSIPLSELAELRSIRVSASYEKVLLPLVQNSAEPVYVGADLSDTCVLLSGKKSAIELLCKALRAQNIDYLTLPVAVPYHTPLVSGKVKESDLTVLQVGAPKIESWACSIESEYPADGSEMRKICTHLFEKPIMLRSTILKLYDADARIFVEVGPKGGLLPYISEVLAGKEHLAVAANLAGKSGIDQLNTLLGTLACHGVEMNLEALYKRRVAIRESYESTPNQYEYSAFQGLPTGFDEWSQFATMGEDVIDNLFNVGAAGLSDEVMITYLSTMKDFHSTIVNSQERMLLAYLQGVEGADVEHLQGVPVPGHFPFLPDESLCSHGDYFSVQFNLSTEFHPFLKDHAIGGFVSSEESKVCLLPLMVALEIMAEGANLLMPDLRVTRLRDIRAYKRIRVGSRAQTLSLQLRAVNENCIDARICTDAGEDGESSTLASCLVDFSYELSESPQPLSFPVQESRPSKLSPRRLYGKGSMFHGPAMQSVESIDLVSKRTIEGKLACRRVDHWFSYLAPEEPENLVIDPLLLDNASQFVLFQMYEHDYPVTALLPFHIDSIEIFEGYQHLIGESVFASANLRAMSSRGTEAQIQLSNCDGNVVARVNDISSRAIVLPERLRDFIEDPSGYICQTLDLGLAPPAVICSLGKEDLPDDETALDWFTDYVLTDAEQAEWRLAGRTAKRRLDWLMGRIAAKDAVRRLLLNEFKIRCKTADIGISQNESGSVEVVVANLALPWIPQVSISHCAKVAVAIAEAPQGNRQSGIDAEEAVEREAGFTDLAFTAIELAWLAAKPKSEQAIHIARLWTAKEAAAKACGSGLSGNPKLFELIPAESSEAIFKINAKVHQGLAGRYQCLVTYGNVDSVAISIVIGIDE